MASNWRGVCSGYAAEARWRKGEQRKRLLTAYRTEYEPIQPLS